MADTGWVIAGTGSSDSTVGTQAWANPTNVEADDGSNADGNAAAKDEQMEYIKGENFGLSVSGTIDGIEIRGQFLDGNAIADITHAQVEHPSTGFGTDQEAGSTTLTASAVNYDYGGASQLHGKSWTAGNVNDTNFAVAFSVNARNTGLAAGNPNCDAIWVKVYYTPGWSGKVNGVTDPEKIDGVDKTNLAKVLDVA